MPLGAQVWDFKDSGGPLWLPPTAPLLSRWPQQSPMLGREWWVLGWSL